LLAVGFVSSTPREEDFPAAQAQDLLRLNNLVKAFHRFCQKLGTPGALSFIVFIAFQGLIVLVLRLAMTLEVF